MSAVLCSLLPWLGKVYRYTMQRYREVETIRDDDGAIAVITERVDTGHLSFRLQREFETEGNVKATSYLGRRHLNAIRRLCDQLEDRLDVHSDRFKLDRARG